MSLTHLNHLEAESIHIIREVTAERERPAMAYSLGKESAVLLELSRRAFRRRSVPFPLLHVDTGTASRAMIEFRDRVRRESDMDLIVHVPRDGRDLAPDAPMAAATTASDWLWMPALHRALREGRHDAVFDGARRDEKPGLAYEQMVPLRSEQSTFERRIHRPEPWRLYNTRTSPGDGLRIFPLANWTEFDIWHYIHRKGIPVASPYFAKERAVVVRDGTLVTVDDERMPPRPGEVPELRKVRFREIHGHPLSGTIDSSAGTVAEILAELIEWTKADHPAWRLDSGKRTSQRQPMAGQLEVSVCSRWKS